jgi:membrane protein insertase Oxa1/YidC/SpoIIIJ
MIGYFGFKFLWPSGLIIYWLSFNIFTMAQQIYLIRKYHRNPTAVGPHPEAALTATNGAVVLAAPAKQTAIAANGSSSSGGGGSRAARRRRSSRR